MRRPVREKFDLRKAKETVRSWATTRKYKNGGESYEGKIRNEQEGNNEDVRR